METLFLMQKSTNSTHQKRRRIKLARGLGKIQNPVLHVRYFSIFMHLNVQNPANQKVSFNTKYGIF